MTLDKSKLNEALSASGIIPRAKLSGIMYNNQNLFRVLPRD